ncbi:MAG: hypothetical protein ACREXU_17215 [Gammaproteobacteria bacterium]
MLVKRVLSPARIRKLPKQFSWVDQRLVRERYTDRCDANALALYLFLVTVADAQGLSYYSDAAIERSLSMDLLSVNKARRALVQASLIAYDKPLYQVLALDRPCALDNPTRRRNELRSLRQWLVAALEKGP